MTPDTPPDIAREDVDRFINAHPAAADEGFPDIGLRTALAAQRALAAQGSTIPERVRSQGEDIFEQWRRALEPIPGHADAFVITTDLLRGLIARAGIMASTLALLMSGAASLRETEVTELEQLFESSPDDAPATDDAQRDDGEAEPLAA